ncbi:uncharacterized protein LOC122382452 isoform X2 [Amphibalanus amphitrite]|uniref:uncharacterized protein LOC122382452 isoform X2 n=1 Tax=Amphibalanus amphitrite TaxID=1232801 RepID=UPI001C901C38|nr:uncharacterized protein LOC122382452 isoform X2 [Amphibalanus amphitrite]
MEQDSETNIAPSDAELSCNTPTNGYYEPDFYLDVAATPLYSYIQDDLHYMKKPIHPYDKKGGQKHFHVPEEKQRGASVSRGSGSGSGSGRRPVSRPGMLTLVDQLAQRSMYETFSRSRSQSPGSAVSADEPIELAHYPDAKVPNPSLPAAIERDDFPAPPYAYSDPERRRRLSGRSDDVIDDEDEVDADREEDPKLKREEAELTKIASGIGKVFLHDLQARKQQRHQQLTHPDPRSTSRTPAANREPRYGMRYQNPVNASPSRFLHNRSLDEDLFYYRYHGYPPVGWATRDHSTLPSTYNMASALRPCPKPGYGLAASGSLAGYVTGAHSTPHLSSDGRDYTFSSIRHRQMGDTQSEDSLASLLDGDRLALAAAPVSSGRDPSAVSFSSVPMPPQTDPQSPFYRRSRHAPLYTPNLESKYPAARLRRDRNRTLPEDVDGTQLERHLTEDEFVSVFNMSSAEFYKLPEWRRKKLKRAVHLY